MTSTSSSDLAPLQSALTSWSNFNLTDRRPHLDNTAQSILDAKETSLKARKQLGELTKSLKRAVKSVEISTSPTTDGSISNLSNETKTTIKKYQEEIDALTRRCKIAESSFVQLYQPLYECVDPAVVLVDAIRLMEGRDGQVDNLLKALEELNSEIEVVRNEKSQLENVLGEKEIELKEAKENSNNNSSGGSSNDIPGGALSLAEREELIRLRSEVSEYEVEFRGLKNQDITIRKLESKIEELEENKEEEIQKELKKEREELAESEGRRATEALEREALTARKLESVELQLRAERAGREASATQLLKAEDGLGEREAAWEAQRQILVQDAERLREELSEVGRERDGYRLKMEASSGSAPPSSGAPAVKLAEYMTERKAYDAEIGELSVTCNALREELQMKEDSISEERRSLRTTIGALERERSSLTNQVTSLELQVANAPSQSVVDKMKHELRILKRLEYNAVDLDPEMTNQDSLGSDDDLESVLVAKLRKIEADLVRERREKSEGAKECEGLQQQLVTVQKKLDEAEKLVVSLENDLQLAVATPATPSTPSRSSSDVPYGSTNPPSANTLQTILDPNAPPLPDQQTSSAPPLTPVTSAAEKANDDHSVATIVMAQRDRLRARCDALEAERDSFKRELQVQVQTAESLKTDNTKLYEKVRYLQSYSSKTGGGSAYIRGGSGRGSDRDLDLEALEQRYEASVDPFRQFSRAERQRKFNEMNPMEKIVFIVAKTTLGNKEMRTALFCYVLALHLLVFVTTYHWSHSSSCDSLHSHEALAHFHGGVPFENSAAGLAANSP